MNKGIHATRTTCATRSSNPFTLCSPPTHTPPSPNPPVAIGISLREVLRTSASPLCRDNYNNGAQREHLRFPCFVLNRPHPREWSSQCRSPGTLWRDNVGFLSVGSNFVAGHTSPSQPSNNNPSCRHTLHRRAAPRTHPCLDGGVPGSGPTTMGRSTNKATTYVPT